MRQEDVFPSRWITSADLKNRPHLVTISHVTMEDLGNNQQKPVVWFQGKDKGMVLNKTNFGRIAFILGEESDDWHGGKIIIFPDLVTFKGNSVMAIRVRPPNGVGPKIPPAPQSENPAPPKQAARPAATPAVHESEPTDNFVEIDDDIPF